LRWFRALASFDGSFHLDELEKDDRIVFYFYMAYLLCWSILTAGAEWSRWRGAKTKQADAEESEDLIDLEKADDGQSK